MQLLLEQFSKTDDKLEFKKRFLNFPYELYPEIKKIPFEIESIYFQLHDLPHDFFLVIYQEKIIARFMLCHTPHANIFYFGMTDFDLNHEFVENAVMLFKKTSNDWIHKDPSKKLLGPISFSTWLPYRLLSSQDGGPLFSFEPDRPLSYVTLLKNHSFKTNQIFSSKCYEGIESFIEKTDSFVEQLHAKGFKFIPFNKNITTDELKALFSISNECFKSNYLATPIDFKTFSSLYVSGAAKDDLSYCYFCYSPEGDLVAFFLAFIEQDHIIAKTVGVLDTYRGLGLSNAMMNLFLKKAKSAGISKMVAAMVKEGAQSESYGRKMSLNWTHLYEILEF